jgi:hypothetical protein
MNDRSNVHRIDCARVMGWVHGRLDGETLEPATSRQLEQHLASCADCRQADEELRAIQVALRGLEVEPFPPTALEAVWERTTRRGEPGGWFDWRAAAAAVVLAAGLFGLWSAMRPPVPPRMAVVAEERPTRQELDQARAEVRLVLNVTAAALRKSERAAKTAIDEVLERRIPDALQKVPIRWPEAEPDRRDGPRNGENDA